MILETPKMRKRSYAMMDQPDPRRRAIAEMETVDLRGSTTIDR